MRIQDTLMLTHEDVTFHPGLGWRLLPHIITAKVTKGQSLEPGPVPPMGRISEQEPHSLGLLLGSALQRGLCVSTDLPLVQGYHGRRFADLLRSPHA